MRGRADERRAGSKTSMILRTCPASARQHAGTPENRLSNAFQRPPCWADGDQRRHAPPFVEPLRLARVLPPTRPRNPPVAVAAGLVRSWTRTSTAPDGRNDSASGSIYPRLSGSFWTGYNQGKQFPRRGVAQSGSAPALGAGSRGFKSLRPDQFFHNLQTFPIPLENPLWMLLQSFGSPRINSRAGKKAHLSGPIDELRASIFPFGGLGGEVRLTP